MSGTDGRPWRPAWWAVAGGLALGAAIVGAAVVARAQAGPPDPAEALRRALRAPYADDGARDRATKQCLAGLVRPGDLRRAATLPEWRDRRRSPGRTRPARHCLVARSRAPSSA